jgi:hypothetical protein
VLRRPGYFFQRSGAQRPYWRFGRPFKMESVNIDGTTQWTMGFFNARSAMGYPKGSSDDPQEQV